MISTLLMDLTLQVVVASVDALAHRPLAELWAVERFPTIKLVTGIAAKGSKALQRLCWTGGRIYDFDGARTVDDLKAWVVECCGP